MPYIPAAVSAGFRALSAVAPPLAVRLGARAFWRVGPPAPVRAADLAVHERATRGAVLVAGARVVTYRWGEPDAPAVLLAHGWQSRASRLAALVDALEGAGLAVVSFDGVAHGDSTGRHMSAVEHVAAIRAVQEVEGRFAGVVGHSIGGLAAGLALHDGLAADRYVAVAAQTGADALAETFLRLAGMPPALHDRFCEHVARTYPGNVPDLRSRVDLTAHPAPRHVPTLFVQDDDDRMTDPGDALRLHAAHPGSELLTTSGLGHNRVLDDPAVLDAVVAHVTAARTVTRR
ncbi:alpha/beta hydrolase [Isoptericola hypogeus]|uniref:Alpha/beta hydrolase n=1 Tax=Isoptericola hypogeus TaxID=300179 RepID=A0ABN2JVB7_9MICO